MTLRLSTMNHQWHLLLSAVLLVSVPSLGSTQDTVTIPKSRLEELERKEAELERLKGKAPETTTVPRTKPAPAAQSNAAAAVTGTSTARREVTPLRALPPSAEGQTVQATDLDAYYRQDPATAGQRFQNQKIVVRGEVVGFETPALSRNYRLLLQGWDKHNRVACEFVPPEYYQAVFTVESGSRLVGLKGQTKVPIVAVGDAVSVVGVCKGLRRGLVLVQGKALEIRP